MDKSSAIRHEARELTTNELDKVAGGDKSTTTTKPTGTTYLKFVMETVFVTSCG